MFPPPVGAMQETWHIVPVVSALTNVSRQTGRALRGTGLGETATDRAARPCARSNRRVCQNAIA
jgi:hypothetical protein